MIPIRTTVTTALVALSLVTATSALACDGEDGQERWVHIANAGDRTIDMVRIKHVDASSWGEDLLGPGVRIHTGSDGRVEPKHDKHEGYCRFDVRITYDGGRTRTLRDVNLCEATELYVDQDGEFYPI